MYHLTIFIKTLQLEREGKDGIEGESSSASQQVEHNSTGETEFEREFESWVFVLRVGILIALSLVLERAKVENVHSTIIQRPKKTFAIEVQTKFRQLVRPFIHKHVAINSFYF